MSSNTPRPNRHAAPRARALARLALLPALLCMGAAAAVTPQTPQQQGPSPAPTPYVRPRTVAPPPAQAPPAGEVNETVDDDEVVRVESNLVLIPASVVDARGRAVTDLRLEDFELKVDGETKLINDLSRAETPVNIALLFDNSQSLSAAREFEKQAALRFFRSVVRPIDRAAIYSFASSPRLELPFTNNIPRLVSTIENFGAPEGATALYDTIAQAADYIRPLPGRKVLVLVSDGSDTLSDTNFEEALNRTLRAECQIYVVQTRQLEEASYTDSFAEQQMRKLTEQTGGAVFVPRSVEDLDAVFTQISLDLSQQYLLSYYPQDERRDKYFRFISVRVKTRPNLRVRARKGFYPSAAQNALPPPVERLQTQGRAVAGTRPDFNAGAPAGRQKGAAGSAPTPRRSREDEVLSRRVGPTGPDDEEHFRPAPASPEPATTFTLTTVATERPKAQLAEAAPTPMPTPPPAVNSAPASQPTATNTPAPAPAKDAAAPPANATTAKEEARPKAPVSGGVLNGKAISLPKPSYPQTAKSAGATGAVLVEVTIDEKGKVTEAHAVSGHPLLQQAAVSAARQARFSPATLSGEPVKVRGTIKYTFALQ